MIVQRTTATIGNPSCSPQVWCPFAGIGFSKHISNECMMHLMQATLAAGAFLGLAAAPWR